MCSLYINSGCDYVTMHDAPRQLQLAACLGSGRCKLSGRCNPVGHQAPVVLRCSPWPLPQLVPVVLNCGSRVLKTVQRAV